LNIKIDKIGIIKNSSIDLNGLTVVTGQNNSGKTTVGKVIYSVIDAVSNMQQKSINDRYNYINAQLIKSLDSFNFNDSIKKKFSSVSPETLSLFFNIDYNQQIDPNNIISFLNNLLFDLKNFDISISPYVELVKATTKRTDNTEKALNVFEESKNKAISIINKTITDINRDPDLIDFARQSINKTLNLEFSSQIQPVAMPDAISSILITDDGEVCFDIKIVDNKVVENKTPVYYKSKYKKTYFIDNPFILDDLSPRYFYPRFFDIEEDSMVNSRRIISHENKLRYVINSRQTKSILEENVINENLKNIKNKIDSIIPGEFISNSEGKFYVCNDVKLKTANLATGSKMFSIIKLLLQKGEIDDETMLILDEPEAHLHPSWQNKFAEIIVLLVKELHANILLTTHSPNFMLAIDAYMRKYEIADITNFYQTEHYSDDYLVEYHCVNDNIGLIYEDFVKYLTEMKQLRNSFLHSNED
jgi:predicted ATP-dependent endonuclease of OLD family